MTDAINDEAFAWNKYVRLFLLVIRAMINITN